MAADLDERRTFKQRQRDEELERERNLRAFLSTVAAARKHGEPWVEWIDAGCPELTQAQYQAQTPQHGRGRRRARGGASA